MGVRRAGVLGRSDEGETRRNGGRSSPLAASDGRHDGCQPVESAMAVCEHVVHCVAGFGGACKAEVGGIGVGTGVLMDEAK